MIVRLHWLEAGVTSAAEEEVAAVEILKGIYFTSSNGHSGWPKSAIESARKGACYE
jgi:hypothetical protein